MFGKFLKRKIIIPQNYKNNYLYIYIRALCSLALLGGQKNKKTEKKTKIKLKEHKKTDKKHKKTQIFSDPYPADMCFQLSDLSFYPSQGHRPLSSPPPHQMEADASGQACFNL